MKTFFYCIALFICVNTTAQQKQLYYDWQWKPSTLSNARFAAVTKKTDSGWLRSDYFLGNNKMQMTGLYVDSATQIRNGWFHFFYANGILESTGRYDHNKREGLWLRYHPNGMISDSAVYLHDEITGTYFGWHTNGFMSDSVVYRPDAPATAVYWFDNGNPSAAGRLQSGKPMGTWVYYHKNGNKAAKELYEADKLVNRIYYNENGEEEKDTSNKNRDASFPGGAAGWKKFMLKKMYFPDQYQLVNTEAVTVVVNAVIDEEGNVTEPFVSIPFNTAFDKIALIIFKKSPRWIPAIRNNRKVKMGIRQPITFAQAKEE